MKSEHINPEEDYQLYFFTEQAIDIRAYFSGLLFNNNNNNVHFNQNLFNFDELAQKIAVLTGKSECYKYINTMLRNDEALKVIMALLFKGFSWRNELYEHFNISSNLYVQNTLLTLQKLKLVVKEKGIKLNPIYFETIQKTKYGDIRKSLHQADIYFITQDFIKFCSLLKDLFEYKVKESEPFKFSLKGIIDDSSIFNKYYQDIMNEELTLLSRHHKTEDGLVYETDTIRSINFKKELKLAIAELKVEQLEHKQQAGLLTDQQNKQLALYKETQNPLALIPDEDVITHKKGKSTITYNGKVYEDDSFLDEIKKQDKIIEESPTITGDLNIDEIRKHKQDIEQYHKRMSEESYSEIVAKIDAVIKYIKNKKSVDYDWCSSKFITEESFDMFLNECINNGIKTDYDNFMYSYGNETDFGLSFLGSLEVSK